MARFDKLEFRRKQTAAPDPQEPATGVRDDAHWMRLADEHRRSGLYENSLRFYSRALELDKSLLAAWVGQVKAVVRRAVLYKDADGLIRDLGMQWAQNHEPVNSDQEIDLLAGFSNFRKTLRDRKNLSLKNTCGGYVMGAEKTIIKKALERTNWNRKKAAGLLSISYKSLLNKIKKYRLALEDGK